MRWHLLLLSVMLYPSAIQAFQPPNARDIAPVETVLLLSSSSLGESLSRVTELANSNGFRSSGFRRKRDAYCPQAELSRFQDDFCFGPNFWSSALLDDSLLDDAKAETSKKLTHLFPGWGFIALAPEEGLPVPVFGIDTRGGFDWFAEFTRLHKRSENSNSFNILGVEVNHAAGSGLFFFRHDTIVYGAYSRLQIERLAACIMGQSTHTLINSGRLFVRLQNNGFERLRARQFELELFVVPAKLQTMMNRYVVSKYGKPIPLKPLKGYFHEPFLPEDPKNVNYPHSGYELKAPSTTDLGVLVKLRFSDPTDDERVCQFAICRAVEHPLAEADKLLGVRKPIPPEAIANLPAFPTGTDFLWISSEISSENLTDRNHVRNGDEIISYRKFRLTEGSPTLQWPPLDTNDISVPNFLFGGGRGNTPGHGHYDFIGLTIRPPTGCVPTELSEYLSAHQDRVAEDELAQIGVTPVDLYRTSGATSVRFFKDDLLWHIWRNEWRFGKGPVATWLSQFLQSQEPSGMAFEPQIVKDLFLEEESLEWSMVEVTARYFMGLHYFFPDIREIDLCSRPVIVDSENPSPDELVFYKPFEGNNLGDFKDRRVVTKQEFPGLTEGDFFADLCFRIRFHMAQYIGFSIDPDQEPGYVIYLLHNTTLGDGIWFTKGQISRVSDSYRKWRAGKR